MNMNRIKGDLIELAIDGEFDLIIHGCNCFCTMGAGIAKTIKQKFPEAYKADLETEKGDKSKLGEISWAKSQT
jgi:O-acetyl-ADP-ribose deacetylase (regulator of RNase III)